VLQGANFRFFYWFLHGPVKPLLLPELIQIRTCDFRCASSPPSCDGSLHGASHIIPMSMETHASPMGPYCPGCFLYVNVRRADRCEWGASFVTGESMSSQCFYGQFKCANQGCINAYQLCNGVNDCDDASDEIGCGLYKLFIVYTICYTVFSIGLLYLTSTLFLNLS